MMEEDSGYRGEEEILVGYGQEIFDNRIVNRN